MNKDKEGGGKICVQLNPSIWDKNKVEEELHKKKLGQ